MILNTVGRGGGSLTTIPIEEKEQQPLHPFVIPEVMSIPPG